MAQELLEPRWFIRMIVKSGLLTITFEAMSLVLVLVRDQADEPTINFVSVLCAGFIHVCALLSAAFGIRVVCLWLRQARLRRAIAPPVKGGYG